MIFSLFTSMTQRPGNAVSAPCQNTQTGKSMAYKALFAEAGCISPPDADIIFSQPPGRRAGMDERRRQQQTIG
jgi:hypothetical protein